MGLASGTVRPTVRLGAARAAPLGDQVKRLVKKSFTRWVKDGSLLGVTGWLWITVPESKSADAFAGPATFGSSTPVATAAGGVSLPIWTGAGFRVCEALMAR